MFGIPGIFGTVPEDDLSDLRREASGRLRRQRHRGPDRSGIYVDPQAIVVRERLVMDSKPSPPH
jgi:asparagine synthase (glutamine-hydrolysing)